jgi:hypothetical protein
MIFVYLVTSCFSMMTFAIWLRYSLTGTISKNYEVSLFSLSMILELAS